MIDLPCSARLGGPQKISYPHTPCLRAQVVRCFGLRTCGFQRRVAGGVQPSNGIVYEMPAV